MTFADLYNEFEDKLRRYAMSLVRDPDRADDLVQETFIRAMAHPFCEGRVASGEYGTCGARAGRSGGVLSPVRLQHGAVAAGAPLSAG